MKPLTMEWIEKAEEDFLTARRELRARRSPNFDAVCFHAQQCVEKYLKARLQEASIPFAKTHDLTVLLEAVLPVEPLWKPLHKALSDLSQRAVDVRYPGLTADRQMARTALKTCSEFRLLARSALEMSN
ncbi:HEPN domain-containing protein [bacterium]|nr:HEPN domain-containing protein [bacterium]MBU1983647.1 HEPN domain-containing protein [bacterium]